jgi:hypothetical protein
MKHFFKYEYGFVNIDADYLYLTSSGNWSETKTLLEKSGKKSMDGIRRIRIIAFFTIAVLLFAYIFIRNLSNSSVSILLLLGIPALGYQLYKYLQHDIGSRYIIPLKKITDLEFKGSDVKLVFTNKDNESDSELLTNIEKKGIEILRDLNISALPTSNRLN